MQGIFSPERSADRRLIRSIKKTVQSYEDGYITRGELERLLLRHASQPDSAHFLLLTGNDNLYGFPACWN